MSYFIIKDITDWTPPEPVKFSDVYDVPIFAIGDKVRLTVGGPDMVVIAACECGTVEVAWAKVDGDVMVDVFPEEALVHV